MQVERFVRAPYARMLALQVRRHAEVLAGERDETLFLLEHERVITLGKNTGAGHVLHSREALQQRGVALYKTTRGGDVTYHGPGQIVGYPILQLKDGEQDIKKYVYRLEEILIRTAADYGVSARRIDGLRGIWVGEGASVAKLGAIGVRIARWTTMHGFSLNVAPDLSDYKLIVACGIEDKGVTSLSQLLGHTPDMNEAMARVVTHASAVLGRDAVEVDATPLPEVADDAIIDEPAADARPAAPTYGEVR